MIVMMVCVFMFFVFSLKNCQLAVDRAVASWRANLKDAPPWSKHGGDLFAQDSHGSSDRLPSWPFAFADFDDVEIILIN
jgi:hypothetical protein